MALADSKSECWLCVVRVMAVCVYVCVYCVRAGGGGQRQLTRIVWHLRWLESCLRWAGSFDALIPPPPALPLLSSLIISLWFSSHSEQMCPLLARPPRHQGVWSSAGEERGWAASTRLHPEEAGSDPSWPGRKSCALNQSWPTDLGSDYLASHAYTDRHTQSDSPCLHNDPLNGSQGYKLQNKSAKSLSRFQQKTLVALF